MRRAILFAALALALASGACVTFKTPEEIAELREGKSFWTWNFEDRSYRVRYLEAGAGENHVLLLHGFSSNTETWRYAVEPLVQQGYHVWAMDFIGHGFSELDPDAPYSFELYSRQAAEFLEAHGVDRAHIVGNSMGGAISLRLALFHQEKVKSITLVDAAGHPRDLPMALGLMNSVGPLLVSLMNPMIIEMSLKDVMHDDSRIDERQEEIYWLQHTFPGGSESLLNLLAAFGDQNLEEFASLFPEIDAPTLVLWGDQDRWIPLSLGRRFHKEIPNSELAIMEDCGHIPQEERPEEFNAILIDFLSRVDRGETAAQ